MVISVLKALPWLLVLALPMFLYLGSKFKIAKSIISFLLLVVVFSSCVTKKQFTYFQDLNPSTTKSDSANSKVENIIRIQPFDVLDIKIKSADKAFDNIFGNQVLSSGTTSGGAVNSTIAGTYYTGFFVDANGVTNLPLLGNVILKNLTLNQAKDLLKEKAKEYLVDPYIDIKFLTFKVKVLGNVKTPGLVTILNEKADVIDALSLAGDLTDFGNPKRIKVIRGELDNNPTVFLIDLTQTKSLGTSGFHLMPNDIIYVEPINRKFLITNLTTVVSVVSILNIIFLGLNVIKLYSK